MAKSIRINNHEKKRSHIPFRLNLLFIIVFVAFAALIIRLTFLQIVKGPEFTALVERTETTISNQSVPRGLIYDSKGRILVGNDPERAIIYSRDITHDASDIVATANELSRLIKVPIDNLTERDLKDYWAAMNPKELVKRTPKNLGKLSPGDVYQEQLKQIKSNEIEYDDKTKNAIAIYKKMNGAYALSTVTIKNKGVTNDEVAEVNERLNQLDGIDVSTDWTRHYPEKNLLRSLLGNVTTETTGLPEDRATAFLNKGYALNDRVGNSYLEEQYEPILRGTKRKIKNITNARRDVLDSKIVYDGKKGDNLVLTLDVDFQKRVEGIAEETVRQFKSGLADRAYIVVMNPKTGDLLAVAGKKYASSDEEVERSDNGILDDSLGAINSSYGMGSSIKAATVLAGYMDGVITLDDNVIVDEPIVFQGSQPKSSVFNRDGQQIPMSDIDALERSSNVYMMKLAMRMGGQSTYEKGGLLDIQTSVFDKLRNYYAQFGLGVKTGIDIPSESVGFKGQSRETFYALDFSYGQYDLYTPLQLAQYMSTIANNGIRVSPRLVQSIYDTSDNGDIGSLKASMPTKIMNHIAANKNEIDRVKQGLYQVVHGSKGTASIAFSGFNVDVAGKTGTAEAFYDGPIVDQKGSAVINSTFVGFAPFENPEIVVAVVLPYQSTGEEDTYATNIARKVFDLYFNQKWSVPKVEENSETQDTPPE
ncbi:peptidoglycan D,D-transpeptidase FtsI family protein [Atopobacter phocae]|uniref:peptidoglycan D,D-transpeptidase FtsI family protein n=1 Tax=Atopobacter phocae TaxID=136492 RepID=UPI00046F97EA|nr:penicillin-binding protein 2 [Atopobacter phocae]